MQESKINQKTKTKQARESHKARNQETKNVFCSISDLHALYDFFGDFPIVQPNNINPNII